MSEQLYLSGCEPKDAREKAFLDSIMPRMRQAVEAHGGMAEFLTAKATNPEGKSTSGGYSVVSFAKMTVFRLRMRGKLQTISVPAIFGDLIPSSYTLRGLKSEQKYHRVVIDQPIEAYADLLVRLAGASVDRYPKDWDCCSRYMECSGAKICVHPDKEFSLSCGYRKILNSGRIFYGANRNVK